MIPSIRAAALACSRPRDLAPVLSLALAASLAAGCGSDSFSLSSPDVPSGGTISAAQVFNGFGCTGQNISPELRWSHAPSGTQSFAVTVFDPDAPTGGGFWHWTIFNIPASATSLPRNAGDPAAGVAPAGSVQGYTDFGASRYGGPCPPTGDAPHRYVFTVYALRVADLGLGATAPAALVGFSAKSNAIASTSFTASYGRPGTPVSHDVPTVAGFTLTSDEIQAGGTIPLEQVFNQFGCTGSNVSPSLRWTGAPAGTQSFALTVFDPDAPTGGAGFWHWLVFNIPSAATSIAKGAGGAGGTPGGGIQGYTDYGASAYGGPCPPAGGGAHRYVFTLYALNVPGLTSSGLGPTSPGGLVGFASRGAAIAKAELTATYGR